MSQIQSFPYIDIAKLVMAFVVVEIHTRPFNDFGSGAAVQMASGIDCVAVPLFLIASGFLCFRGLAPRDFESGSSAASFRVLATVRKQLSLYATWTSLLLPLAVFGAFPREWSTVEALARFARGVVLVGENELTWPLWYLLASVVAFALVYILLRGLSSREALINSPGLPG